MRYITAACPQIRRMLLVESGSRAGLEKAIPKLRDTFGAETIFDLVTCHSGAPAGVGDDGRVWRTQDHTTSGAKAGLLREIRSSGSTVVAILCSDEAIMTRWKWWLAWRLASKVLIVNENGDFFWLDTTNLRTIAHFVKIRMGVDSELGAITVARLAVLPFAVAYLLLYASVIHARRAWRRALTRIS